jgi:hypothetical protein
MKYVFTINQGPTVFLQERRGNVQRDQRIHTALRLVGLLLVRGRDPIMEPRRGVHHRKYTPDVISGDGKVWVEAGKVSPGKLLDLAGRRDLERIIVVQAGRKAAKRNAEGLATRRTREIEAPVTFYGWRPEDVETLSRAIYGRNEIEVHEEREGLLDLTINGERLAVAAGVWKVDKEGLRQVFDTDPEP